jgi:hypothetical protein
MSEPKSALEAIAGSPLTEVAGTLLALGYPLAALLPVLTNTLAFGRYTTRVESTLAELNAKLLTLSNKVGNFTDAQFSLTVGIIKTIFETIDEEKLRMLKAAVLNVGDFDYLGSFEAQLFSRILRDVSAAEIAFLAGHRRFSAFSFANPTAEDQETTFFIMPKSPDETVVRGLINLGLIARSRDEGHMSDKGEYLVAPFVTRLLDLIEGSGGEALP